MDSKYSPFARTDKYERGTLIAIVSGGMDSVTMTYRLIDAGYRLHLLSFDYGQRHKRELKFAMVTANKLGQPHTVIPLDYLQPLLTGSALTDASVQMPHGYYAEENMRLTVVPNRNMVMLSIAAALAVAEHAVGIATGVHAGDHYIYPDCRPSFIHTLENAIKLGNEGHIDPDFRIITPYLYDTKVQIVQDGARLGVDYRDTYTCYEGGVTHCGVCGSCQERRAAFVEAGITDPTTYTDLTIYEAPK